MAKMGRPRKLTDRRVSVMVYFSGDTLEVLDDYIYKRKAENKDYSRSDFVNEAVSKYLNELGVISETSEQGRGGQNE